MLRERARPHTDDSSDCVGQAGDSVAQDASDGLGRTSDATVVVVVHVDSLLLFFGSLVRCILSWCCDV